MLVTLQLVAVDASTDSIEVSTAVDVTPGATGTAEAADAVAARAHDAALFLMKQIPCFGDVEGGFVPLANVLPRA